MKKLIPSRLAALRKHMQLHGIDAYLVPTDDFHASEYVGSYFKCREFITGFTGSAGTAVITQTEAGLWTDGRYFLQASQQLEGTTVTLFRSGEPDVPTVMQYLKKNLKDGACLGFDGRCISAKDAAGYAEALPGVHISCDVDLVGDIWEDRPALSCKPVFELGIEWTGRTRADKFDEIRGLMKEKHADLFLLTSLDDIAWLLNMRGDDVLCNPVILSYLVMTNDEVLLFIQQDAIAQNTSLITALSEDGVHLHAYEEIYAYVKNIPDHVSVLLEKKHVNTRLVSSLPSSVRVIDEQNPTLLPKARKNPVEIANERKAHIKDGVAVTRFLYWIKNTVGKEPITEISAAQKLYRFRAEQEHFYGESFEPILAYGPHAAIVHYSATPESDIPLEPKGLLLADTGGQYLEGTTDITRTIVLGELTEEEKLYFTAVLRGHLRLGSAKFPSGCVGQNLDILARQPLWELGMNYRHGTGHGVGYYLNVHEEPNRISYHYSAPSAVFEEGMITSDEPGYYADGKFGIRHENLMVCKKAEKTAYGQFLTFEPLTMVPFDLDGIAVEMMTAEEISLLNEYHRKVYETISPYLSETEKEWLKDATRPCEKQV